MAINERRWLTIEEATPEFMGGMWDEREPRHRRILDFVDVVHHDSEDITVPVVIHQRDEISPIVGFGDRIPYSSSEKIQEKKIAPFHIKDGVPFGLKSPHLQVGPNKTALITEEGVVKAVAQLDDRRINLHVEALLAMINAKVFTYEDGDKVIYVPYDGEIGDLTNPGTQFNDTGCDPYYETDLMKDEFGDAMGQAPDVGFISGKTATIFKQLADVRKVYTAQQSSDPDRYSETYEQFMFNGIMWIPLRTKYATAAGLQGPISEGRAVMTVNEIKDSGGRKPFSIHKAANKLNGQDSTRPKFDSAQLSKNPVSAGVDVYDNELPSVNKQNIVQHFRLYAA